jgi:hypothetical protein
MKLRLSLLLLMLSVWSISISIAQCTPQNEETCPDPENNGQLCPDTLQDAEVGKLYSQEFTILAPPIYVVEEDTITLHHIQLMSIDSLPEGITWISNSPDTVFMVGTYYCVLLEGTPNDTGLYNLRITVDIYAEVSPVLPPIKVGSQTDSTSLSITVRPESSSIAENLNSSFQILESKPNPFSRNTVLGVFTRQPELISLHVYDLIGKLIYHEDIFTEPGENFFHFNGEDLQEGMYIYSISNDHSRIAKTFIKTR